jgi:hypothetical protein
VQIHKDYHASIEAARVMHFTMSRPANDFFHLMQKRPTIAAKLANTEMQGGVYVKTELGWVIASLEGMRHLPTIDLWSALWGPVIWLLTRSLSGFLRRYYNRNYPRADF